jgi:transcriptional regulator with XRE-family HTH domain
MAKQAEDPAMTRVRALFEASGMTMDELGLKMGYPPDSARKSVWQFLRTSDPRIGMLRRFALAMGKTVEELVGERKGEPKKSQTSGKKRIAETSVN